MNEPRHDSACAAPDAATVIAPPERRRIVNHEAPGDDFVRSPSDRRSSATDASSPDLEELGTQVGNYRLLREIGRGGMGVVYLAARNDEVFRKVVALKVIGSELVDDEFVERFKKERQILAGLDHPNIARILDGGNTADGRPFYAMEYVAGVPLDEHCSKSDADARERVRLVAQVCEAVDYLHDQAIVHRDLKPRNILVTSQGQIKLIDFGIARVQTVDRTLAPGKTPRQSTLLLTPGYASPEQLEGAEVTKQSDLYSLAAILYELLAGRLPFADASGTLDLAAQLSGAAPLTPSTLIANRDGAARRTMTAADRRFSSEIDEVVLTALNRDAGRRHPTVRAFGDVLGRALQGFSPNASGPRGGASQFLAANRLAVAAGVLVIAIALATAFALQARVGGTHAPSQATQPEKQKVTPSGRSHEISEAPKAIVPDRMRQIEPEGPADHANILAPPARVPRSAAPAAAETPDAWSETTALESSPDQTAPAGAAASPLSADTSAIAEHLQVVAAKARLARQNVELMRERLAHEGQVLRPVVSSSMTEVESLVEQARTDTERRNTEAAEAALRKANYMIRRIVEIVGR